MGNETCKGLVATYHRNIGRVISPYYKTLWYKGTTQLDSVLPLIWGSSWVGIFYAVTEPFCSDGAPILELGPNEPHTFEMRTLGTKHGHHFEFSESHSATQLSNFQVCVGDFF